MVDRHTDVPNPQLANHLRRKITAAEGAGLTETAELLTAKLKATERADRKAANEPALTDLTKAELVDKAKAAGVEGYSTMNKDELVTALEEAG